MGLADYSAWTDALDKVTGFAANKADQKNDEKAKLDLDDFNNQSDETIQKHELYPYDLSGPREGTKPASMEATTEGKMDAFTSDLDSVYPTEEQLSDMKSRHRVAFEASRNAAISKFRSSLRLKESKTLVAKNKANALTFDTKTLTDISDLNKSLTPVFSAMEGNWKRREENALNGGLMENPHQVRVAKIAFYTKLGKALKGRFDEGFIGLMDHGVITSRKDLEEQGITGTKGVSVGRYDSYMQYYRDMFHNGEIAGYKLKLLFPDQSKEAVARESHDLIFGELTKNRTARQTGATATFNSFMNDTMERAHAEQRDFTPSEAQRLRHLAFLSGKKISAHVFNFRERMRTKPTTFQKIRNDQLELKFQQIVNDAVNIGAEPDFTAFSSELAEAFTDNTLHASDAMKMYKELSSQKGKQAGRINTAVSDIIKKVRAKVYIKPKVGGTGKKKVDSMRFDLFNEDMPGNVERSVRSRVRAEILRSGDKPPDLDKVYQETLEYINETVRAKNPSTIHIDRDELEDVYRIKSQGGELSPREQLVFDLSLAKINRNSRFARRASDFMAARKKAVRAGGGDLARFKDKYKRELAFLQPGNYSYEKMYQKYFMVPKKEVVSPTEGKKPVDQAVESDDQAVVEGDSTVAEDTGEKSYEDMTLQEFLTTFQENPKKVWDSVPEGDFKERLRPHLKSFGLDEDGSIKSEKIKFKKTVVDEADVINLQPNGQMQTDSEYQDSQREAAVGEGGVASTLKVAVNLAKDTYNFAKDQVQALGAAKKKGDVAVDEYKAGQDLSEYPFWKARDQVVALAKAGYNELAEQLNQELNALSAYWGGGYEPVPLKKKEKKLTKPMSAVMKGIEPITVVDVKKSSPKKSTAVAKKVSIDDKLDTLSADLSGKKKPTATIKARSSKPQSTAVAKKVSPEKEVRATNSPLVTVLKREGVSPVKPRSKSADPKEPLITASIRSKVVAAIKKAKKKVVSIASLGGDFFSPKKRAEDIAKLLGESWIKIDKPSLPVASKGKDKLGMNRGDAYNYMFELHVNVLRSERISEREKDKVRDKLSKFDKLHKEASAIETLEVLASGIKKVGEAKSLKHKDWLRVDDYVVSFVRELEDMLKFRWSEFGVF